MRKLHTKFLVVIIALVVCSGCITPDPRTPDPRPPLINDDNFWDFVPWWYTNTIEETNNVAVD